MEKINRLCNQCGQAIADKEYVEIEKNWGYFSNNKDGQIHRILLCEDCYDRWIDNFQISPEIIELNEIV